MSKKILSLKEYLRYVLPTGIWNSQTFYANREISALKNTIKINMSESSLDADYSGA